jgi:hypothetical protein
MESYYEIRQYVGTFCNVAIVPEQKEYLRNQHIRFNFGTIVTESVPNPFRFIGKMAYTEKVERPPHFLQDAGIVLLSELFISFLREAGVDNFKLFPATVEFPQLEKTTWTDYYVFNEIGLADVANMKRSQSTSIMEGEAGLVPDFIGFEKLIFSEEKLAGKDYKMLRMVQDPIPLIVSKAVMRVLLINEPTEKWGLDFSVIPVESEQSIKNYELKNK